MINSPLSIRSLLNHPLVADHWHNATPRRPRSEP